MTEEEDCGSGGIQGKCMSLLELLMNTPLDMTHEYTLCATYDRL